MAKRKKYKRSPEIRKKMSEARKRYYAEHPEWKKEHSERIKKYHREHPEFSEKCKKLLLSYNTTDPVLKEKYREAHRKLSNRPEVKAAFTERSRKMWGDSKKAEQILENMHKTWDKKRIQKAKKDKERELVRENKEYDVSSNFFDKERNILYHKCVEIMGKYGLEPIANKSFSYYKDIV